MVAILGGGSIISDFSAHVRECRRNKTLYLEVFEIDLARIESVFELNSDSPDQSPPRSAPDRKSADSVTEG